MTRNEKIGKLAWAVREWIGLSDAKTGKFIRPPKPSARKRVVRWMSELDLDEQASFEAIARCKTWADFNAWVKNL